MRWLLDSLLIIDSNRVIGKNFFSGTRHWALPPFKAIYFDRRQQSDYKQAVNSLEDQVAEFLLADLAKMNVDRTWEGRLAC